MDKRAIIDRKPMQLGDIPRTYAEVSKLKKMTGYDIAYTLEEGIRKFIEWYKKNN